MSTIRSGVFLLPALAVFFFGSTPCLAQAPDSASKAGLFQRIGDTIKADLLTPLVPKPLQWKAIVVPTVLISYGTLSVASGWFDDVNLLGKRWASGNNDPNRHTRIDDYIEFAGPAAVYALNIAGVRGKNNVIDASMLYAMSYGIAHIITIPTKEYTRQRRPDSSDLLSFPSGHTSNAFIGAEFLRQEYKDRSPWIGAGGYAVAVLTGYLRMYNNKHWFADVVAGAGVGILSTRLSYWIYPKIKNLILGKDAPATAIMLPTWQNGGPGICLAYRFK